MCSNFKLLFNLLIFKYRMWSLHVIFACHWNSLAEMFSPQFLIFCFLWKDSCRFMQLTQHKIRQYFLLLLLSLACRLFFLVVFLSYSVSWLDNSYNQVFHIFCPVYVLLNKKINFCYYLYQICNIHLLARRFWIYYCSYNVDFYITKLFFDWSDFKNSSEGY